jgi:4-amino-4-deoxy-L-arabinose transferase-like glycosyltransferase
MIIDTEMNSRSRGTRECVGIAFVLTAFLAINARWLWIFRHGQPLDIDEAGFFGLSMLDYYGFVHNGIVGFIDEVESRNYQAPLTTALTGLIYCITGPHVIVGFAVPLLAGAAIIAATYFLGLTLGSGRVGLLSAVLVAACPMIIIYSRSFLFALPATFLATMALLALLRSRRLLHLGWVSLFGICCGLMPLARTMTIAFVPGFFLGAAVYAFVERSRRRQRYLMLAWAMLLTLATTGTWLGPNARPVLDYLLSFGYGDHAAEYGEAHSLFGVASWLALARMLVFSVHLPHFLFMLAGVASLLLLSGRCITRHGFGEFSRMALRARALPVAIYVAEATLALASSRNKGNGFFAPIVPAAIILAVWSCHQLSAARLYRSTMATIATGVIACGAIPALDLNLPVARPWLFEVPLLGPSIMTDGRAYIELYEAGGGFSSGNPSEPIDPAAGRAWVGFSEATAAAIQRTGGKPPLAFGFRHYLYNVNTVGLQELMRDGTATSLIQVDPVVTGDTVAGDLAWLTVGAAARACLLLTSDAEIGQIQPVISNGGMVDAARQAGFRSIARWVMPDRHDVRVWTRRISSLSCETDSIEMQNDVGSP